MFATTRKADSLIQAITDHEGWYPPCADNGYVGSRSYRHHNQGNLRASPFAYAVVDNFAVFRSDHVGYMALHWDLLQKAKGNTVTGLTGDSTVRQLLFIWAPPSDNNDSEAYVRSVYKKTGFTDKTTLKEVFDL